MSYVARNHPQQAGKRGALASVDDRAIPQVEFDKLNERFRFTIDACENSDEKNRNCDSGGNRGALHWIQHAFGLYVCHQIDPRRMLTMIARKRERIRSQTLNFDLRQGSLSLSL